MMTHSGIEYLTGHLDVLVRGNDDATLSERLAIVARLERVVAAPAPILNGQIQVNSVVKFDYTDTPERIRRGVSGDTVRIGAAGENFLKANPPIYASDSPLGRTLLCKTVGASLSVSNGILGNYKIKVSAVDQPPALRLVENEKAA